MNGQQKPHRVVKLGGSLLAWPPWPAAWRSWQRAQPPAVTLMVVGGGAAVDDIRRRQARGPLSDEQAHWLAIETMSANARQVSTELAAPLVTSCRDVLVEAGLSVLDPLQLLRHATELPRHWQFTSDSIAAWVAWQIPRPRELVLLKSCPAVGATPSQWSLAGQVDRCFPAYAKEFVVRWHNLRGDQLRDGAGAVRWCWLDAEPR